MNDNELRDKRALNLEPYKWKPGGPSPNPAGRPKRRTLSEELAELLAEPVTPGDMASPTKLRALAEKLYEMTAAGNMKAADILARVYEPRKPATTIDARTVHLHNDGEARPIHPALANAMIDEARLLAPIEPVQQGTYPTEDGPNE